MAKTLAAAHPDCRIVTRRAPNAVIRILAIFDKSIRTILGDLDVRRDLSAGRAKELFAMDFIGVEDSIRASVQFILDKGPAG